MQIYFVAATYTNNVYKLSDFFLSGDYKKDANKMLNKNLVVNDGRTNVIISGDDITLGDGTDVRDHTHIIVPDYNKIYKIEQFDWINVRQLNLELNEDALIGNYLDLESEPIILSRTNDHDLFRGQNDIADLSLKEFETTKVISSDWKTGKWALLFYQYATPATPSSQVGFSVENPGIIYEEKFATLNDLITKYPEVDTDEPEKYPYFQRIVVVGSATFYQCVYDGSGANSRLYWVIYNTAAYTASTHYVQIQNYAAKINQSDVISFVLALPLERTLISTRTGSNRVIDFNRFVGPTGTDLIDIKIVNDLVFRDSSITYNLVGRTMQKTLTFENPTGIYQPTYTDAALTSLSGFDCVIMTNFEKEIDLNPSFISGSINPKEAEPFYKYELYVYGNRFSVPYYLTDKLKMMIAINSGVINYLIYYDTRRNIIASGSFTHSIKYSIDQLDAFYSENPTYKDQFYLKMASNATKTVVGGAVAGGMAGPIGVAGGAAVGIITAGVDAGLSLANHHYMEKGLMLKPDQIHGENSEIAMQLVNLAGIYWVKKESENKDLMEREYDLRGFPTSFTESIDDLNYATSLLFGTSKIVFGDLKPIIRNQFTTNYINERLKEGIILIP